jgi:hypothetical protein
VKEYQWLTIAHCSCLIVASMTGGKATRWLVAWHHVAMLSICFALSMAWPPRWSQI